jgi:hypothetical protein
LHVKDAYPVKFLVTSCTLLYDMWLDIPAIVGQDSAGTRSPAKLPGCQQDRGVYLLAGDLHFAHAVRAELYSPQGESLLLWEFCSSPFEQEPTSLSRKTYFAPRIGVIKKQELIFTFAAYNFGLVRVDFVEGDKPKVRFELYGQEGELIDQTGE